MKNKAFLVNGEKDWYKDYLIYIKNIKFTNEIIFP
jgi:hypothetical protein